LLFDRTVRCWGFNGSGQLGDSTTSNRLTPVVVSGLSSVIDVAAGGDHTCALRTNGLVFCWGFNFFGQLGTGLSGVGANATVPQLVGGGTAYSITAGAAHSCWLGTDLVGRCWGANSTGQIGDDSPGVDRSTPVFVTGLAITSMVGGGSHSCGGTETGDTVCWGRNASGQVGDGTAIQRNVPTGAGTSSRALGVVAGWNHTCALLESEPSSSQTVGCWGENADGQVGDGTSGSDRLTSVTVLRSGAIGPLPAIQLTAAIQVDAGGAHTCAVLADGTARCWGSNSAGQLGIGTVGGIRDTASATVTGLVDS
jgi:alpha-tubulin suppressor-like RCC1 family protein